MSVVIHFPILKDIGKLSSNSIGNNVYILEHQCCSIDCFNYNVNNNNNNNNNNNKLMSELPIQSNDWLASMLLLRIWRRRIIQTVYGRPVINEKIRQTFVCF